MKKIKLTVLTLLLGSMCYGQKQVKNDSLTKEIMYIESVNTVEDMVEWMKSDINNLVIDKEIGELYVQNMLDLLSKLEDINTGYIKID
tara:strand:- start:435 stop:698 length:264 start_codon:yes stop_codon:yes gene_type:complete